MGTAFKLPSHADHVGSLLRPPALTAAFRQFRAGEIDDAAFAAVQDQAITDAVRLQEEVGLKAITDGEFRRASYWGRFVERVDGLEVRDALFRFHDHAGHESDFTAPHVAAKVRRSRPIAEDEYLFLSEATAETAKLTLPSPPTMHFWRLDQGIDAAAYDSSAAFFDDLAAVYAEEIRHLAGLGLTYVQLDEVPLAMLCDPAVRERVTAAGLDPARLVDDYIGLFARAIEDRPAGMVAAIHLCRGNFKGQFLSEGGYEEVAEKLFNEIPADAYFLEYDTPRAGDFAPLRLVPKGKTAVLGLVSSKTPELEPVDALGRRIDEAARHLALDQLALSPQCGFASTVGGNPIAIETERAKLALVVRVAEKVWG
ncbi:MAG: 5-methyltetrahydropteroyltriglutamate--homocysteine S-methyltransferase [Alphaproteobacteria bacterium]|jgi:5-methyltetrahydropteroyltriglutamate--homocysteine methyltransferase|nr:5-methyltetrahydropteroyltriglutamate--homocysteine S-methyltransferase [Alphaproteobacteria bacterium]